MQRVVEGEADEAAVKRALHACTHEGIHAHSRDACKCAQRLHLARVAAAEVQAVE